MPQLLLTGCILLNFWWNLQADDTAHANSLQQQGGKGNKSKRSEVLFQLRKDWTLVQEQHLSQEGGQPTVAYCCICYAFTCYRR